MACAYLGGAIVAALGVMSAISIIGRSATGRPIPGDFELVEIGTAIAGSLFLPWCQATGGHIVVDVFTHKASGCTRARLDRAGALLMAAMFLIAGWRTAVAGLELSRSGAVSMVLGVPTWLGYVLAVPGVSVAGIVALMQSLGVIVPEPMPDE